MTGNAVPSRSLRALLVDVGPTRQGEIADALEDAGWSLHADAVHGTDALSAAIARRGWDVVIYGGEGADAVPARKAMALVRVSDPQLAFVAAVPSVRPGDLSAFVQGFGPEAIIAPDPARLPDVLEQVLAAAHDARPDADSAHRLLLAQQAITDHVAAGLPPDELCRRVLATLGETLGWTYGAVWRPDGESSMLRPTATWHDPAADQTVSAFADVSRRLKIAPGRGLPGRTYAFRRAGMGPGRARRRQHAATHARRARRAEHRGRVPDRARRRMRRGARVLLRRHPGAGRPGRRAVRDGRRAARPVPRAAPAGRRREPPGRGDAPRRARPGAALPRRRRDHDRRARPAGPGPATEPQGLRGPGPLRGRAARPGLVRHGGAGAGADDAALRLRRPDARRVAAGRAAGERGRHAGRRAAHDRLASHAAARRRRGGRRDAVVGRGRDRPPPRRAADHLPRVPRRADRARQPDAARGAPQARAGALPPHGRGRGAAAARHRQLQADQRLARASGRRRADLPPGRASAGVGPHDRPARAHGRRRVPTAARRPARRSGGDRRAGGGADRRLPRRAVHGRRRRVPGLGLDRHRARAARRARRRGAAGPRRLRDVPGEGRRPRRVGGLLRRPAAIRSSACRWRRGCGVRCQARSSSCTTSRSSTPRPAGSSRSRRCCAGTTRSSDRSSRPPSSSRWQRRPA